MIKRKGPNLMNPAAKPRTLLRRQQPGAAATEAPVIQREVEIVPPVPFGAGENMPITELLDSRVAERRARRDDSYTHVSDLLGKCMRQMAIINTQNVVLPDQRLSLSDSLAYRMGDAVHDVVKERVAASAPTKAWGLWKCKCGALAKSEPCLLSEVNFNVECDLCHESANRYKEVSLIDEELGIIGHPDLILYLERKQALYVTEIKSIAPDHFKSLVSAQQEHVIQVLFYWLLLQRAGYRLIDQVSVFYVSKGYMFKGSPYKEITLKPSELVPRLGIFLDAARELKAAREGGQLPPRTVCKAREDPKARKCPVARQCFEGPTNVIATISASSIIRRRAPTNAPRLNPRRPGTGD